MNKGVALKTASTTSAGDSDTPTKARKALQKKLASGELHPLLISFDTPKCVFPLRISTMNGRPSEVSLYVISKQPLLEKFTFGMACEKLARSYAKWEQERSQRVAARARAVQNGRQIGLATMMHAQRNRDRLPGSPSRPRNWSNEDMEALAKESTSKFPEENLGEQFWPLEALLQQMHLETGKIPKCEKAIPRLKGKDWNLTKVVWTFSPTEMQDLEFMPAIRALAPIMSEKHGGVAARLLDEFGEDAMPLLLAACKSGIPTERLNGVRVLESRPRSLPPDLLMALGDSQPRLLHAANDHWDRHFGQRSRQMGSLVGREKSYF